MTFVTGSLCMQLFSFFMSLDYYTGRWQTARIFIHGLYIFSYLMPSLCVPRKLHDSKIIFPYPKCRWMNKWIHILLIAWMCLRCEGIVWISTPFCHALNMRWLHMSIPSPSLSCLCGLTLASFKQRSPAIFKQPQCLWSAAVSLAFSGDLNPCQDLPTSQESFAWILRLVLLNTGWLSRKTATPAYETARRAQPSSILKKDISRKQLLASIVSIACLKCLGNGVQNQQLLSYQTFGFLSFYLSCLILLIITPAASNYS